MRTILNLFLAFVMMTPLWVLLVSNANMCSRGGQSFHNHHYDMSTEVQTPCMFFWFSLQMQMIMCDPGYCSRFPFAVVLLITWCIIHIFYGSPNPLSWISCVCLIVSYVFLCCYTIIMSFNWFIWMCKRIWVLSRSDLSRCVCSYRILAKIIFKNGFQ